ncbi:MAG: hypothetical protein ACJ8R9_12025 [Steroidobacteraceae bacterium]
MAIAPEIVWFAGLLLVAGLIQSAALAQSAALQDDIIADDSLLFATPTTRDHIGRIVAAVTIDGRGPLPMLTGIAGVAGLNVACLTVDFEQNRVAVFGLATRPPVGRYLGMK